MSEYDPQEMKELQITVARLEEQVKDSKTALVLQAKEYERRLEVLNHAHQREGEIRATYLSREAFETNVHQTVTNMQRIEDAVRDFRLELVPIELYNERHDLLVKRVDELKATEIRREGAAQGLTATGRVIVASVGTVGAIISILVLLANNVI